MLQPLVAVGSVRISLSSLDVAVHAASGQHLDVAVLLQPQLKLLPRSNGHLLNQSGISDALAMSCDFFSNLQQHQFTVLACMRTTACQQAVVLCINTCS